MPTASQEISLRDSTNVAALSELKEILLGKKAAEQIITDPEVITREIVAQILSADSDEELQINQATPWQDLAGIPVEIHGFRWRPSSYEEGAPVFVVVDANRMDNGDRVVLTTGSYNILAQLTNLAERERFPSIWKLEVSTKATSRGYYPLWLVKATPDEEALAKSMTDAKNPLDED